MFQSQLVNNIGLRSITVLDLLIPIFFINLSCRHTSSTTPSSPLLMKPARKPRKYSPKCGGKCEQHRFEIKSLVQDTYFKNTLSLRFCPKIQLNKQLHQYPIFNNDEKFYTQGFTLGVDQSYFHRQDAKLHLEHDKRVEEALEERSSQHEGILEPKPNRKHKYCGVCKMNYEEYRDHILAQSHKDKIAVSKFNQIIRELSAEFNNPKKIAIQSTANSRQSNSPHGIVTTSDTGSSLSCMVNNDRRGSLINYQQSTPNKKLKIQSTADQNFPNVNNSVGKPQPAVIVIDSDSK